MEASEIGRGMWHKLQSTHVFPPLFPEGLREGKSIELRDSYKFWKLFEICHDVLIQLAFISKVK